MPLYFTVPEPKPSALETLELKLKTGTPVLGGSVFARKLNRVEPIRIAAVRGQLRFWWRATTADATDANMLFSRERELWGGVDAKNNQDDCGTRSAVRVVVDKCSGLEENSTQIELTDPDAYALWPARGTKQEDPAPRWKPGLSFRLRVTFPKSSEDEVRQALAAWICFGGYGSRTRRGVGQLVPDCEKSRHLVPQAATQEAIQACFPKFFSTVSQLSDWPRLRGMHLALGIPNSGCLKAWHTALGWLRDFRQAEPPRGDLGKHDPNHARVRGANNRPSVSNWPEADKVRQLSKGSFDHLPQHNAQPVWPRAALGLPIIAQFQRSSRNRQRIAEPDDFELGWLDTANDLHDRLASPLILGSMPIASGSADQTCNFVPFGAWLARGYPEGNVVMVRRGNHVRGSEAAFDQLVANGDQARFQPLADGQKAEAGTQMRTAFFGWLSQRDKKIQWLKPQE